MSTRRREENSVAAALCAAALNGCLKLPRDHLLVMDDDFGDERFGLGDDDLAFGAPLLGPPVPADDGDEYAPVAVTAAPPPPPQPPLSKKRAPVRLTGTGESPA